MSNSNSKRWWMTGISAVCLAGVTTLWAADPITAPSATPGATPAVAGDSQGSSARSNDQSNNDRSNRGSRSSRIRNSNNSGNYGNNGYNGYRSSGGGAGTVNPNDPYAVLQVRSIFVKGNQSLIRSEPPPIRIEPKITQGSRVSENLLVFNGVTIVNDKPQAFVEDLRSNVVFTIGIGDSIADGIVDAINFDDLSYLVRGQVRHVGLGDDFTGNAAYALMTPTTVPVAPTAPGQIVGTGASIPPVAAPTQSGLSNEDILARMKAKRAQESQQIAK